ncbi:flagellar motor switch protein FliM, partial [Salmonella enterica subsp. enterica serovar Kentucky]
GDSDTKDCLLYSIASYSFIRPYYPNTQRRFVRERLQSLEIINERFSSQFMMGLCNLLRRIQYITVGAISIQPYHE